MRTPTQAVILEAYRAQRARGLDPLTAAEVVRGDIAIRMIRKVARGAQPGRAEWDRLRVADQHVANVALLADLRGERPRLDVLSLTNRLSSAHRQAVSA